MIKKNSPAKSQFDSILLSHLNQSMVLELGGKAYKTVIRGEKKREYLIVDIPSRFGAELPFLKNEQCVVRFMHEGMVFGFITFMQKKVTEPVNLLILEYPEQIEEVNLRQSKRMEIFISVDISKESDNATQHIEGYIVDLSAKGCRIVVQGFTNFSKDEDMALSFTISPGGSVENLPCFIKHTVVDQESIQLGIKFYESDKKSLEKIENFIKSCSTIRDKFKT